MNYRRFLFLVVLVAVAVLHVYSQPAIGEWTDYQSYGSAKNVVDAGNTIYCVTDGGLFSYSKTDNSIQKLTNMSGLSDVGVQRVAYSKENDVLLIAYKNANIDLLIGNKIYNLSDIKRKQLSASKSINNVMFSGNLAYLSCGFGIVVINLDRKEIKDSYIIGQEGAYLNVLDMATDGSYLYAATSTGIYKAQASNPNLQNYNSWIRQTGLPHFDQKFNKIEYFKGKIIANYNTPNDAWAGDELYQFENGVWSSFLPDVKYSSDITTNGNYIVFSSREEIFVYNDKFEKVNYVAKYPLSGYNGTVVQSRCAVIDSQNVLWIAYDNGLVRYGTTAERIAPQGPVDNKIFSMITNGSDLWIASGGRDESWGNLWSAPKFQLNRDGEWSVFDSKNFTNTNDFRDVVCVAVDPNNADHVFAGSWGGGVLEFNAKTFVKRYDNYNSSLQTQLPSNPTAPYVRIGGMNFDSKGNLWVSNTGVAKGLSMLKPDGAWTSYELSGAANKFTGKVVVTQNNDKWVVVPRGNGLSVLNSTNDVTKEQKVIAHFSNLTVNLYTEMNDVYALAEDLTGKLWVGTSTGVAVFSTPKNIWKADVMYATRPSMDEGDNLFHPLLEKESITAIAIDGANRKWFGTKNSGVYLISEDGEKEIEHFNTTNSPLPSDEITDMAINQKTGEVFIGTVSGLVSYMGEAISGNEAFADVYVYPNPVRETYDGPIVVKGLVENTDVKITDIAGNLVYKTVSLGGQAVWDGKNLNGNRCKTGVYLVFMNDPTGEKTKITKLLFIH